MRKRERERETGGGRVGEFARISLGRCREKETEDRQRESEKEGPRGRYVLGRMENCG